MAKGIGLIGNFKGKVGNTVGYKLTASNNGQTQGIRVYQPIVKNPKSAGQAEQRAKLLAVNGTYRALKMVIDRGNEGLPYGNKSRLAWLKTAMKSDKMPWFEKGSVADYAVGCTLTKGSLQGIEFSLEGEILKIQLNNVPAGAAVTTVGGVSAVLKAAYSNIKDGDQITIVSIDHQPTGMVAYVVSFIIDTTSSESVLGFTINSDQLEYETAGSSKAASVIVSRLGDSGEHLRSTSKLLIDSDVFNSAPYNEASKAAAIASYRASAASNSDWAEESIQ